MKNVTNGGLYKDPMLAQFYDATSQNRLDFEYCLQLAKPTDRVLDLGCGTGELAVLLAEKCQVTGVEPAAAMLDIARQRSGSDSVSWVEADARNVRLDDRFDLIVLTGHSFQVFLNERDQQAVLATIAHHLKPDGRFIFDSRNPDFTSLKSRKKSGDIRLLEHAEHGQIEMWNESNYDEVNYILTYKNGFRVVATGEEFSSSEQIHYASKQKLAQLIEGAGLYVDTWLGDWLGAEYLIKSREIIPFGGRVAAEEKS